MNLHARSTLALCCLCIWTLSLFASVHAHNKIRIKDINTLTFHSGTMTTGRRSAPVPQMSCVGGPAKGQPQPVTAMCTNIGFDGRDVAWKCEADMPNNVRFGRTDVSCEGYDYPDDPFILAGSCGLEYTLEYTGAAPQSSSSWSNPPSSSYNTYSHHSNQVSSYRSSGANAFSSLFMFVVVAAIFWMVFKACAQRGGVAGRVGGGGGGPGFGGGGGSGFGGYGGGFGGGGGPGFGTGYGSSAGVFPARPAAAPGGGGMGGFWGGMLGGGALGYLLGSRRNPGYNQGYGYGGNQFGGGFNSFGAAPPPQQSYASGGLGSWGLNSGGGVATGTHHSTGFGGTRRR